MYHEDHAFIMLGGGWGLLGYLAVTVPFAIGAYLVGERVGRPGWRSDNPSLHSPSPSVPRARGSLERRLGDPAVSQAWLTAFIKGDRARMSNTRGRLSFAAMSGAATDQDTRSTQVFINYGDNSKMDLEGFAAFGEVITSMVMVERIFDKYGEGVDQAQLIMMGNAWLTQAAPQLDYIKTATIAPDK